jgi:hypothetical protein
LTVSPNMPKLNLSQSRILLQAFEFGKLFVEELGWERHAATLKVQLGEQVFQLRAVAQKRGLVAFICDSSSDGNIPDYPARRKIETQVAKTIHEHIIVYADRNKTAQVWQWVKREPGKPAACRERAYHRGQTGDPLIQRLQAITFTLEEEEGLTIVDVSGRIRAAFDVEKITKRFYDRFKTEHDVFLKFINGIPDKEMQRWYASVMINRLMFIYFIQKKGFLDSNLAYLRSKLAETKKRGKNVFYSEFLCVLFFKGFAETNRTAETKRLLGVVPYLNGGLFLRHQIEELHGETIDIPDAAFEKLFDFFDAYQWHLDERPLRDGREINPDVLGYIFEKYINQKQMGAYYTKEDITEYISKNTIIPCVFDKARQKCKVAFEGEASVWRLLEADPDRYFYDAVKKGVDLELPSEIASGLNDVSKRTEWNKPAPDEYALPTEIWREVVARRKRYEEVREKLASREVRNINDLVTYNLDIRQFAQDVITNSEGPELLRAVWHAIVGRIPEKSNEKFENGISILDPTCGSGAFLFAALSILEPLYDACLDRMQVFVDELDRSGEKHDPKKFIDFRKVLERVDQHPNHRYFVLKSIIINNLFGVDIMDEAIEICKLRLFLKLVAQVESSEEIEPLPDIDFNIRAGNSLVGFTSIDAVREAVSVSGKGQGRLIFGETAETITRIEEKVQDTDRLFNLFRRQQTERNGDVTADDKEELRNRLASLENELDGYLASEYGIDLRKNNAFEKWLHSHEPFHWFIDFYSAINSGGFDVIIGNPPYVETSDVKGQYSVKGLSLLATGNLFSLCVERFTQLLRGGGRCGVIVPVSSVSTPRMFPLMKLLTSAFSTLHLSNFAVRPGKLFVGVDMNLTIVVGEKKFPGSNEEHWSTKYNRWQEEYRPFLFFTLLYAPASLCASLSSILKIGSLGEASLMKKLFTFPPLLRYRSTSQDAELVYYHSGGRYFRKCIREQLSNEYKELSLSNGMAPAVICLLSSSLYYWFWIAVSDCYHVTRRDVDGLPAPESLARDSRLKELSDSLLRDLYDNARTQIRNRADGTQQRELNFIVGKSKRIVDEIDYALGAHYGLTAEEFDTVINYDIKYRGGSSDD